MNTIGRESASACGWLMTVDMMSWPGGATHTLDPRPRPASCVRAVKVKPVGSLERSFGFLLGRGRQKKKPKLRAKEGAGRRRRTSLAACWCS